VETVLSDNGGAEPCSYFRKAFPGSYLGLPTASISPRFDFDRDGRTNLDTWASYVMAMLNPMAPWLTEKCPWNSWYGGDNEADSDEDGIGDACDNCALVSDLYQLDWNRDGIGDVCEESDPRRHFLLGQSEEVLVPAGTGSQDFLSEYFPELPGGQYRFRMRIIGELDGGLQFVARSIGESSEFAVDLDVSMDGSTNEFAMSLGGGSKYRLGLRSSLGESQGAFKILSSRVFDDNCPFMVSGLRPEDSNYGSEPWSFSSAGAASSFVLVEFEAAPGSEGSSSGAKVDGLAVQISSYGGEFDDQTVRCPVRLENLAMVDGLYDIQFDYVNLFNQPINGQNIVRVCDAIYPFSKLGDFLATDGAQRMALPFVAELGAPGCDIEFCVRGDGRYVVDNVIVNRLLPLP